MDVLLSGIAKSFGREIVFQGVNFTLASGSRTAILGPNGSGKSTLLQVIGGALVPTEGTIEHRLNGQAVQTDEIYRYVSIAAPYLGLYEELSLRQTIEFHTRFKLLRANIAAQEVAGIAYLETALDKPLLHFSSGMKQRLKLALAILSDTPLLLLDEPASNLDAQAIEWYQKLLAEHLGARTLVVASNRQTAEHGMCEAVLDVTAFKP